jgi:vesicle-fusing ATPase
LATILRELQAFDTEADLAESLNLLRGYTGSDEVGVGIKKVLLAVGEARQEKGNVPARFADIMEQLIASGKD